MIPYPIKENTIQSYLTWLSRGSVRLPGQKEKNSVIITYEEEGSKQYKKLDRSKIWDQSKTTLRLIDGPISTYRRSP